MKLINKIAKKVRFVLRKVLAKPSFYKFNRWLYLLSLNSLGVLNYENRKISGESFFLEKLTQFYAEEFIVFDIGANIGNYSSEIKQMNPKSLIYAFEPHPSNYAVLEKVAEKNSFFVFNYGCGSENQVMKLYDYGDHRNGSSHASIHKEVIEKIHNSKATSHDIKIIKLDEFLAHQNIQQINLVKIDVEGNEYNVIQGLSKFIAQGNIDIIHFEFNSMNLYSKHSMRDFFDILSNYNLYRMLPNSLFFLGEYNPLICEIYNYQNIVAINKLIDPKMLGF
jgi:FkbM family methyltransferase